MLTNLRRSIVVSAVLLVICGIAYPLAGVALSQLAFSRQANGSLTRDGSALISQTWPGPKWFQGRPDGRVLTRGTGDVLVSGTNQPGPRSRSLASFVETEVTALEREDIVPTNDLVTTSGSLLDPDISPADAYAQVPAVARARHLWISAVRGLVAREIHPLELGFLGARYANVLELNMALSRLHSVTATVRSAPG